MNASDDFEISDAAKIPYVKIHSDSETNCPVCSAFRLGGESFAEGMTHLEYEHSMRLLHVSSETDGTKKRTVAVFGPTLVQRNRWSMHEAVEELYAKRDATASGN